MLDGADGLTSQAEEEEKRRKKNCATFQVQIVNKTDNILNKDFFSEDV